EIGIVSDARLAIQELSQLNRDDTSLLKERKDYCRNLRQTYEELSLPKKNYCEDFVDLEGMIYDLQEQLPGTAIIANCAGNYTGWIHRYYQFTKPKTYV